MAILIYADVLIEAERRTINFDGWIASQRGADFKLAAITVSELQHGIERAAGLHRLKRERFFKTIFPAFEILPFTFDTALVHARLWATLESTGQMIGPHDLIALSGREQNPSPLPRQADRRRWAHYPLAL